MQFKDKLGSQCDAFPLSSPFPAVPMTARKICNPDVSTWMRLGRAAASKEAKDAEHLFRVGATM